MAAAARGSLICFFGPVLVDFVAAVLVVVRSWMGEALTKVDHHHQTPVRSWRLRD